MTRGGRVPGQRVRTASNLYLSQGVSQQPVASHLQNLNFRHAEPNDILSAHVVPNHPRFGELWGMLNTGPTGGSADSGIDADMAFVAAAGNSNANTDVSPHHPGACNPAAIIAAQISCRKPSEAPRIRSPTTHRARTLPGTRSPGTPLNRYMYLHILPPWDSPTSFWPSSTSP